MFGLRATGGLTLQFLPHTLILVWGQFNTLYLRWSQDLPSEERQQEGAAPVVRPVPGFPVAASKLALCNHPSGPH